MHTQLPLDYYSLPFCAPPKIERASESLGEFLTGNKILNSVYKAYVGMDDTCKDDD